MHFKTIANTWQSNFKWDGISALKFEAALIHVLSDVFVAVAVVVANRELKMETFSGRRRPD